VEDMGRTEPRPLQTIGQLAARSGVSVRALHLYDEVGLLKPTARGPRGARLYAPAEVERLDRIVLLRRLGLSLEAIGDLLDGRRLDVATVLAEHATLLRARLAEGQALLERLDRLLAQPDETLSDLDTLATLLQESIMFERYFDDDQIAALRARAEAMPTEAQWKAAFARLAEAQATEATVQDPVDEAVREVDTLIEAITGGDPAIRGALSQLWREHRDVLGPQVGLSAESEALLAARHR